VSSAEVEYSFGERTKKNRGQSFPQRFWEGVAPDEMLNSVKPNFLEGPLEQFRGKIRKMGRQIIESVFNPEESKKGLDRSRMRISQKQESIRFEKRVTFP